MNRRELLQGFAASALVAGCAGSTVAAAQTLPKRRIPSSGEALPIIGFGNSNAFRSGDQVLSNQLLDVLVEHGGRFVDSHGRAEQVLGRYLANKNDSKLLFIGSNVQPMDRAEGTQVLHRSLEIQGKDSLDVLLFRQVERPYPFWNLMREWKAAGLTRHIGMAFTGKDRFDAAVKLIESGDVDLIQANYSMLEPEAADRLLPAARDNGVAFVANRPFVNGRYFPLVKDKQLPAWASEFDCNSWAQFSLKYIVSHPAVSCAITETSKPHHALDNMSGGLGRLPDQAMRKRMRDHLLSL